MSDRAGLAFAFYPLHKDSLSDTCLHMYVLLQMMSAPSGYRGTC